MKYNPNIYEAFSPYASKAYKGAVLEACLKRLNETSSNMDTILLPLASCMKPLGCPNVAAVVALGVKGVPVTVTRDSNGRLIGFLDVRKFASFVNPMIREGQETFDEDSRDYQLI